MGRQQSLIQPHGQPVAFEYNVSTSRQYLLNPDPIGLKDLGPNHDGFVPQQVEACKGKVWEELLGHLVKQYHDVHNVGKAQLFTCSSL